MAQITLNSSGVASDGALVLQSNGTTTAVTISTAQVATIAKDAVVNGLTVGRGAGAVSTNTAVGASALAANTTGANNTAVGYQAANSTTSSNVTAFGYQALYGANWATPVASTAVGYRALYNGGGNNDTAVGYEALASTTSASGSNTAVGKSSLTANTSGALNTALGSSSLTANTTGSNNTVLGALALQANTTASYNTAVGYGAAYSNTTGAESVAIGNSAMRLNTTGNYNVVLGAAALYSNTTASNNTALGYAALYSNTTASNNTAVGYQAGYSITTGHTNCFIGYGTATAATTGLRNVSVGDRRLEGGDIFNLTTESDRAIFGHNNITNAYVKVAWTVTSDARDKTNINPIPHGLEFVKQLNPVSYNFKKSREDDTPYGSKRYGFLAQDILALEGEDNVIIDNEQSDHLKYQGEALVPVLVKAIQELKAEFDAYKEAHP